MSYRKLGRNSAARKALFTSILTSFFRYGRIETTEAKAKELRKFAENLITLAKRGDLSARRQAIAQLAEESFSMRSQASTLTARAVTRVSSSSAFAAAMLLRWSSSSSCNPHTDIRTIQRLSAHAGSLFFALLAACSVLKAYYSFVNFVWRLC